jgi:hypothetical protein
VRINTILFLILSVTQCATETGTAQPCRLNLLHKQMDYAMLLNHLPAHGVEGLAKAPTTDGALGRNKAGYFHVRFQMDIAFLATYAVNFESDVALMQFVQAVEYSFQHQTPAGDFTLVIPAALTSLGQPTAGDLASGIAFFLSALGPSLVALQQSPWFASPRNTTIQNHLTTLRPKFVLALHNLKMQQQVLYANDAKAPNRLLFDAVAFYAMGIYLADAEAQTLGIRFAKQALALQHADGYFIESGGFDSSYNGVALRLGLTLSTLLSDTDAATIPLHQTLACAAAWQANTILRSGEISAEGNTRVYAGGEQFLGTEKQMAWVDTWVTLHFVHALSGDEFFAKKAKLVEGFYVK